MGIKRIYSVQFIDGRDGKLNHKTITADSIEHVCYFMRLQGHDITEIKVIRKVEE